MYPDPFDIDSFEIDWFKSNFETFLPTDVLELFGSGRGLLQRWIGFGEFKNVSEPSVVVVSPPSPLPDSPDRDFFALPKILRSNNGR